MRDNQFLRDLKLQVNSLKSELRAERQRINTLEEGSEVDFGHLQVEGAGLKELFRMMQELKTDILLKAATRDAISSLEREVQELRKNVTDKKIDDAEL